MSKPPPEECTICLRYTGRAGKGEDSLYDELDQGPYCEECFERQTNYLALRAKDAEIASLRTACVEAQAAVQAFWDMVRVMREFQALPIPSIIETADHNCPIILKALSDALGKKETKP
jgi:hypothetical protein